MFQPISKYGQLTHNLWTA
uniref:Uncharacterized protein n=1 Tax=Anguilla anguilla TaxID=7936 RepID=A0A0E9RIT3_ANGAN